MEEDITAEEYYESKKSKLEKYLDKKIPKGIFGYSAHYVLLHPFNFIYHRIEDAFYATKWGFQRMFRGWDDTMVWSIDYYLADLIPKLVRKLKEITHGTPIELYPKNSKVYEGGETTDEEFEKAHAKWLNVLEEIAEGFEAYHDEREGKLDYKASDVKFEKAFKLFKKHFGSLWD